MNERYERLQAELEWRRDTMFAMFPEEANARVRTNMGGWPYTGHGESTCYLVWGDCVAYLPEVTALRRAMDAELAKFMPAIEPEAPPNVRWFAGVLSEAVEA